MTDKKFKTPGNIYSAEVYAKTKKYQKKYGFEIGTGEHDAWNNESDAFKHTFGAADIALKYYVGLSKYIGDYHEKDGNTKMGQSKGEENMDQWNNQQGRQIAQKITQKIKNPLLLKAYAHSGKLDDMITEEVMSKMKKGSLITKPTDPRKYVETPKKDTRTAGQKFDDMIRGDIEKIKSDQNEKLKKVFGKSKSGKSSSGSDRGHWVTINGAHVYLEN